MNASFIPTHVQDMIDDFAFLTDWEDRYMHVIDMGKSLPELPPALKTDATRVNGCVSQVWLVSDHNPETGHISYTGDSDAHIVKGLVAIVINIFSGQTARDIVRIDPKAILTKLGLSEHLSPQRSNGLNAMIGRIQAEAKSQLS